MPIDRSKLSPADEVPGASTLRLCYWGRLMSGRTVNLETIQALAVKRGEPVSEIRAEIRRSGDDWVDGTLSLLWSPRGLDGLPPDTRLELRKPVSSCRSDQPELGRDALAGADGLVFVFDPQANCLDDNRAALVDLRRHLDGCGRALARIPLVVQENKQDLKGHARLAASERLDDEAPELEGRTRVRAIAMTGEGLRETVAALLRAMAELEG